MSTLFTAPVFRHVRRGHPPAAQRHGYGRALAYAMQLADVFCQSE